MFTSACMPIFKVVVVALFGMYFRKIKKDNRVVLTARFLILTRNLSHNHKLL